MGRAPALRCTAPVLPRIDGRCGRHRALRVITNPRSPAANDTLRTRLELGRFGRPLDLSVRIAQELPGLGSNRLVAIAGRPGYRADGYGPGSSATRQPASKARPGCVAVPRLDALAPRTRIVRRNGTADLGLQRLALHGSRPTVLPGNPGRRL